MFENLCERCATNLYFGMKIIYLEKELLLQFCGKMGIKKNTNSWQCVVQVYIYILNVDHHQARSK